MKTNYVFVVNEERNGFEVHFKEYNRPAWDCLIKRYKLSPMAKKSFVYASPKRLSEADFVKAYEAIARCLEFTKDERKAFDKQLKKVLKAAYPKKPAKPVKAALKVAETPADFYSVFE